MHFNEIAEYCREQFDLSLANISHYVPMNENVSLVRKLAKRVSLIWRNVAFLGQ